MDHYLDIRLLPDADFAPEVLLNALYAKLHRMLVTQQHNDIGVSFPGYRLAVQDEHGKQQAATLGLVLRLHGNAGALDRLMARRWLTGFTDHTLVGAIQPVPANAQALRVIRRQAKSNPARERERLMRRKGISAEEAAKRIPDSSAERLPFPFLVLDSISTGQRYRLFVEQKPAAQAIEGPFNTFGLSHAGTVPTW